MISYNNSNVVQYLRQYDMFANSLNLIKNETERNMIIKQLTKLEEKIISVTNDIYEEEYTTLVNRECNFFDEEKDRLSSLVELINQRLSYVEKRCNNHYQLTGYSINVNDVLGADQLDYFENKIRIIDKYLSNVKLEKELEEDIKSLTNKISLASEKIDINQSLNVELENTFKETLESAFTKLDLYDLLNYRDDIEYAYYETEKSLNLAKLNYETAKNQHLDILPECKKMLDDVTNDYNKYKDKICTLKLMEVYKDDVDNYEGLVAKRKEINDIIEGIKNSDLLNLISPIISKQYSTITMEEQDINTFDDLTLEKERKLDTLASIREENDSEEFRTVLNVLIENERKKQEKILEEQRRIEEEEKQKKLEIERKKQEELLKRQRIIEEARKKEIEKRTKQLLEEQQNSVLQGKKKEKKVSFESIKDSSNYQEEAEEKKQETVKEIEPVVPKKEVTNEGDFKYDFLNNLEEEKEPELDNSMLFKNKVDIEKELFDEFNNNKVEEEKETPLEEPIEVKEEKEVEEVINDNKFPDMSIDEYMKSFDETKLGENETLNDFEDSFPSIPV